MLPLAVPGVLAAYGAYEGGKEIYKYATDEGPVKDSLEVAIDNLPTKDADSILRAAGVSNPTEAQKRKFGELYKTLPVKNSAGFASIARQVAAMPAEPVTTTTSQTQYGPPTKPASYGGGGGGAAYNAQVAEAQQILTSLGFDPQGIDGKLGPNTRAAISKFQAANGLPATGNLDAATFAKLQAKKGSKPSAAASSKGMSTAMKVGLALAGAAVIGGGLYFVLKDDEPGA